MEHPQIFSDFYARLIGRLPTAELKHDQPDRQGGNHWLDVRANGKHVATEWKPGKGFGVSLIGPETGYGEGHDHVFPETEVDLAVSKVVELLV